MLIWGFEEEVNMPVDWKILLRRRFMNKNWETNINQVSVEPCDEQEDPLGYKAVFFLKNASKQESFARDKTERFEIGASYLAQRELNLLKAGYIAPMTNRAITLIETKIGERLPTVYA